MLERNQTAIVSVIAQQEFVVAVEINHILVRYGSSIHVQDLK